MKLKLYPSDLAGFIKAPSSKSYTHRALICAALAPGKSVIKEPLLADDIFETIACLKKIGATFKIYPQEISVFGAALKTHDKITLEIKDSASTLRFLIPLLSCLTKEIEIKTTKRMWERINTSDLNGLRGLYFSYNKGILTITGKLKEGLLNLSLKFTSQWLSGLIFALPLLPKLSLQTDLPFSDLSYPDITLEVASKFGISFLKKTNSISYREGIYQATCYSIEGDYSAAANWLAASCFSEKLKVGNLEPGSMQADYKFFDYTKKLGIEFQFENGAYSFLSRKAQSAVLDLFFSPDLFPVLAALAATSGVEVRFAGLGKLKYKESNRVRMMVAGLKKLGIDIKEYQDEVVVKGEERLTGDAEIETANDHRIIMAYAILAAKVEKPFILKSFRGVSKSYPDFFEKYISLGGKVDFIDERNDG
ncbi:MAG: 3-phosphoshikimate 1-carboxyvinyltransferase [Bacilli bacterium]|jgi:3-phosphoshikimate 1-carboxyvinyltransferase